VAPVHADLVDRAVGAVRRLQPKDRHKEAREFGRAHLTAAHREAAVADATEPADVTVDRHIVGWVGEDEGRLGVAEQLPIGLGASGIGTQEQMRSEDPEIARATDRLGVGIGRNDVLRPARLAGRLLSFLETQIDFGRLEADQLDLEVEVDQGLQLDRQDLAVPAGSLRQAVVGQDVRPPLGLGEVGQPYGRHHQQAQQLGGSDAPVAGDDLPVVANQHRVAEAEPLNAFCNLPDLLFGVGPGVAGIGLERFGRKHLDLQARVGV
jgi:hypothetical protein